MLIFKNMCVCVRVHGFEIGQIEFEDIPNTRRIDNASNTVSQSRMSNLKLKKTKFEYLQQMNEMFFHFGLIFVKTHQIGIIFMKLKKMINPFGGRRTWRKQWNRASSPQNAHQTF